MKATCLIHRNLSSANRAHFPLIWRRGVVRARTRFNGNGRSGGNGNGNSERSNGSGNNGGGQLYRDDAGHENENDTESSEDVRQIERDKKRRCRRLSIIIGMLFLFHGVMLLIKWLLLKYMKDREVASVWIEAGSWFLLVISFMLIKILIVDRSDVAVLNKWVEGCHVFLHTAAFALSFGFDHTPIGKNPMVSLAIAHVVGFSLQVVGSIIIQKIFNVDSAPEVPECS